MSIENIPNLPEIELFLFGRKVILVYVGGGVYYSQDVIDFEVNKEIYKLSKGEKNV